MGDSLIGHSTAYDYCRERLSPFGGLLGLVKFLDLVRFREIFKGFYKRPERMPDMGHYNMVYGILLLLFIGFTRVWHFLYIQFDPLVCGLFDRVKLPSFLSLLPSEAGGGIRGMVLFPRAPEGSPPTCRLQYPEDPAPVFSRSLSPTGSGKVDPLTCPKCRGIMQIISFIEDREIIQAILKHLGLWLVKSKPVPYLIREPVPKAHAPPALNQNGSGPTGTIRDPFSQLPMNDDHLYRDLDYAWDAYLQS